MSTPTKKRVLVAALAAFLLWPIAHHLLVLRYELNPWKFGGWSMYCTPPARISLELLDTGGDRPRALNLRAAPPSLTAAMTAFSAVRKQFGRLAPPVIVAREAFAWHPGLRRVRVVVHRLHLDPETDRFESTRIGYEFTR